MELSFRVTRMTNKSLAEVMRQITLCPSKTSKKDADDAVECLYGPGAQIIDSAKPFCTGDFRSFSVDGVASAVLQKRGGDPRR